MSTWFLDSELSTCHSVSFKTIFAISKSAFYGIHPELSQTCYIKSTHLFLGMGLSRPTVTLK